MSAQPSALGRAAGALADAGWRVFPLAERSKVPRKGSAGCLQATSDREQVRAWWSENPSANIGLAPADDVLVLDVDTHSSRREGSLTGAEGLAELEAAYGPLPRTLEVATPTGGRHLYFFLPRGRKAKNRVGVTAPSGRTCGLDVRTEGGYVLAPPSVHPRGGIYSYVLDEAGRVSPMVDAPGWLVDVIAPPESTPRPTGGPPPFNSTAQPTEQGQRYAMAALRAACDDIRGLPEGFRHQVVRDKAHKIGGLLHLGLSRVEAEAALVAAAMEAGKGEREARRLVSSGLQLGEQTPLYPQLRAERERPAPSQAPKPDPVRAGQPQPWTPADGGPCPAVVAVLSRTMQGTVRASYSNAVQIARLDPRLASLRMSALGGGIEWQGRPVSEGQITADLSVWLAAQYQIDLQPHLLYRAAEQVARERVYSPVVEYLRGLCWDGEPRVGRVLREVLGVEATALHEAYLGCTLKAAVARAIEPGCKADTALVLIGGQGAGKSTFFRVLFGSSWFGDSPIPIGSKDAAIQLQRCWGYEAAEMESLTRRSAEEVKQFMSTSRDLVRLPYQRQAEFVPRHSVLVGTVNRGQFLTDDTGSRRFWPVVVPGRIDVARLEGLREQLWAEAVVNYNESRVWWLSEPREAERVEAAAQHMDLDLWEDVVRAWLDAPAQGMLKSVVLSDVLHQAVGMPVQVQDDRAKRRVGAVMQRLGWGPRTIREGGAVRRVWTRIGP